MKLSQTLADAFKKHIALESGNAVAYLLAYSWHRVTGFEGFSKRYKNESIDEMGHAQNWTKYLARREMFINELTPIVPKNIPQDVKSFAKMASDLENQTEKSMRDLAALATKEQDEGALNFIDEKLIEQEKMSQDARDFANRINELEPDTTALIDRRIERDGW